MTLAHLLAPRSIAVFGASPTPLSFGWRILTTLERLGFDGEVYPINPRHDEVLGHRCYPDFDSIPPGVDAAAFCVNSEIVTEQFPKAAARGLRSAAIFDTGFADAGAEGALRQQRLRDVALAHDVAVVGPNCMGVLSPASRSSLYSGVLADPTRLSGNVAVVTQSGAIAVGLLTDCRRFGFSHVVSCGNEAVLQTPDFVEYLVDDPNTRVLALFVEAVRDVDAFTRALDRAAAARKPVVVLKVGKSARGKQAVAGHTGSVAGDGRAFSALLRRHRAIEVDEPDELAEVLAACQSERLPQGPRIGLIAASGGQVELFHDVAQRQKFSLPALTPESRRRLADEIGVATADGNPLDAWGDGDWRKNLPLALEVVGNDPNVDSVVFTSDTADDQPMQPTAYGDMVAEAARESAKPHYFFNTRPALFRQENVEKMRGSGAAVVGGVRQALGAIHKLGLWAQAPVGPPARGRIADAPPPPNPDRHRASINEFDAKRLLAGARLPTVPEVRITRAAELRDAAAHTGFPAVLKVVSDDIPHRSEQGLVRTGLADHDGLKSAFAAMEATLAASGFDLPAAFVLQRQIDALVEVFAGVHVDPELGPCLLCGPGGVLVELLDETAIRPLPLREGDVEAMIDETRLGRLLAGFRGQPAADRESLTDCLYRLAELGALWGDAIREMDVNPILVAPEGQGCMIVDAVIFPRPPATGATFATAAAEGLT